MAEFIQEIPARDEVRRHVDESHRMALDQPAVAGICRGCVEHRDDRTVRIQNRRAGARQGKIVSAEMLFPMHGHGTSLGEAGSDAVGAFVALVPQRAERQAGLTELALQGRIGDGRQHHALCIRQDHRESRPGDLLVETLHFRARDGEQLAHSLLQFLEGLGIEHGILPRCRRLDAVFPKTSIPRARDVRFDSGGLESVLDHMKNARRVTRGEIQVCHVIPLCCSIPCWNDLPARCGKPTVRRALAKARPPPRKAWPLCANRAICTAAFYCWSGGVPNL